jgi:hypothetical protein
VFTLVVEEGKKSQYLSQEEDQGMPTNDWRVATSTSITESIPAVGL